MRLNTASATAYAAACTGFVDRGQEFADASAGCGRDERKLRCACAEGEAAAQAIKGHLRARSIRLVHDNDVGDLKNPRLHRLHLIATLGAFYNEEHIGEPRNADLGLPGTNRLYEDQIKPGRLNQNCGRSGDMGK